MTGSDGLTRQEVVERYPPPTLDREDRSFLGDFPEEDLFCPFISVDDHVLEPADIFTSRLPRRMQEHAPRLGPPDEDGTPWWIVGDRRVPMILGNGIVGRPMRQWETMRPARFDDFRPGVYDPKERLRDMDVSGIWASLCFPSITWGFAGRRFKALPSDVGIACLRAYNDWMIEEWCAADPERYIPCQMPWLPDAEVAAAEVRRNAERGFKAVSFSENPEGGGHPTVYDPYWDPFFAACEETGTVVNLHVGSAGTIDTGTSDSPRDVQFALFPTSGLRALVDWVFAKVPIRFPRLKIALSEAGVSWVPMALERLARAYRQAEVSASWLPNDPDPVELAKSSFYFTSIEDPSAFHQLDLIGLDHVMVEADYPHPDTTWPTCQAALRAQLGHLDARSVATLCYGNAARLYRHPEPPKALIARASALR